MLLVTTQQRRTFGTSFRLQREGRGNLDNRFSSSRTIGRADFASPAWPHLMATFGPTLVVNSLPHSARIW